MTPGHPEVDVKRGVENIRSSGSGTCHGCRSSYRERFLVARFGEWMAHKTYAFISDGGIQEEIPRCRTYCRYTRTRNLIMFYDSNNIQLSTKVDEVTHEDTAKKYEAWGWQVITIDGNDAAEIRQALKVAQEEKERPTLIIGHTLMGKGAVGANEEDFSNKVSTHGQPLSAAGASFENTVANLGGRSSESIRYLPGCTGILCAGTGRETGSGQTEKSRTSCLGKSQPGISSQIPSVYVGRSACYRL
ncbi:MAG: hypothetical protein ACLUOS_05970 [Odoribacter splanchnicus]